MAQPSQASVHIDVPLTMMSVAYMQATDNFIADKVFPVIPVDHQTDKYWSFTKGDWFRDEAQLRGDSDESAGSGFNLSTGSYSCDVFSFHKDLGPQAKGNADDGLDLEAASAAFVTQRLLLRREIQWVADYFTSGIWATDVTPGTLWSSAASDPITDVDTGKETILSSTGFEPNTLVLGYQVWRQLKNHPDIVDRYKYTSADSITPEMVARLFEVDRILVAKAIKNTANEGATATMTFTHGKHALLAYVNPAPSKLMPSAGYTYSWRNGVSAGMGYDIGIKKFEIPHRNHALRIEGDIAFDHKAVSTDCAYFFASVVA